MPTIRAARHYQKPDAPVALIARHGQRKLQHDLRMALSQLRALFDRGKALHLIRNGRLRELRDTVDFHHLRNVLKGVFERWAQIYEAGAALGARKINGSFHQRRRHVKFRKTYGDRQAVIGEMVLAMSSVLSEVGEPTDISSDDTGFLGKSIGDRFTFDRFDQVTQDRLKQAQDDLIQQVEAQVVDTIHAVVIRAQQLGLDASEIVDDIRDVIGLTDTQAVAVMNYENMLYGLDPGALRRQLRDSDMDAVVRGAIDSGVSLDEAVISELVDAYQENYLDYRAKTIAQTESVRAANWGLSDSYRQAVDRGALPEESVTRFWQLGDHPCPICESIPDANPDGVGVNEDFESNDGPQDDPPVHPNCECSVEYVTDLSLVPEE